MRPFAAFPFIISSSGQGKPLSIGTNDDKYCASSTSIPFGYSSERYPLHATIKLLLVVSVPNVATCTSPSSPLSFLMALKIFGK